MEGPAATVLGIKRLLNYDLSDLSDYREFENHQILLTMRRAVF